MVWSCCSLVCVPMACCECGLGCYVDRVFRPVPLESVSVVANVVDTCAEVTITQVRGRICVGM